MYFNLKKIFVLSTIVLFVIVYSCTVTNKVSVNKETKKKSSEDSIAAINLKFMNEVLASIKGKENTTVDSVFHNIKSFKGVANFRAEHFLKMMNSGWSKALGVTCNHCHNTNDWASDEKPEKEIARQMWALRQDLNRKVFPAMKGLNNATTAIPRISCNTCHNGRIIPLSN